jgi:UDP-glucose 6-dehydrogenase
VVEKSTLPVRTAEAMERTLKAVDAGARFDILSIPEFLAERAIAELECLADFSGSSPHCRCCSRDFRRTRS